MKPLVLLNFKTYQEAAGKNALLLAKQLQKVHSKEYEIVVAPSILMLKEIADGIVISSKSKNAIS